MVTLTTRIRAQFVIRRHENSETSNTHDDSNEPKRKDSEEADLLRLAELEMLEHGERKEEDY